MKKPIDTLYGSNINIIAEELVSSENIAIAEQQGTQLHTGNIMVVDYGWSIQSTIFNHFSTNSQIT